MLFKFMLVWVVLLSVTLFFLALTDKISAKRKGRRIPERTLLGLAACGGAPGLLLGMLAFRHKTKHKSFVILTPLFCVLWAALLIYVFCK